MEKTNEQKYRKALMAAKKEFKPVKMDKKNTHYGKYASLNSVMSAVEVPLRDNGFNITHTIIHDSGMMLLKTMIEHEEYGDHSPSYYPLNTDSDHKFGSSITYGRRYTISAKLGLLTEEDDDGNASVGMSDKKPKPSAGDVVAKLIAYCKENGIVVGAEAAKGILKKHGIATIKQLENVGAVKAFEIIKKATGDDNE